MHDSAHLPSSLRYLITGDRPRVPNVAVVLTDGKSTWEANNTIPEATLLKEDGVKIFSIGIGSDINVDELNAIASNPTRPYVYQVESFSDLIVLIGVIVNSTCHLQRGRYHNGRSENWSELPVQAPMSFLLPK